MTQRPAPELYKTRGEFSPWSRPEPESRACPDWLDFTHQLKESGSALIRFNVLLEELTIHVDCEENLIEVMGGESQVLMVLQQVLKLVPDRVLLYLALSNRGEILEMTLVVNGTKSGPYLLKATEEHAVIHGEWDPKHQALSRALLAVLVLRALRERLPNRVAAPTLKRDVGVALLALGADDRARSTVTNLSVREALADRLHDDDPFLTLLTDILEKNPLRRMVKIRPQDNIFVDPLRFDGLTLGEKWKVILSGQLAWYTTLSFGLLWLFHKTFDAWPGYYSQGRVALTVDLGERGMFKKTLRRRVLPAILKGKFLRGVELFWSGWNPNLTRVTLRPFFRLLGGNKRPFWATFLTFIFSGFIVHLMGTTTVLLAVAWLCSDVSSWAGWLGSETNITIQVNIWIVYLVFGFIVGLSKAFRSRSKN
jgi:hypothetical protein